MIHELSVPEIIGKTAQLEFKIVDDMAPVAAEIPAVIKPGEEEGLLARFAGKLPADDEVLSEGSSTERPERSRNDLCS